MFVSLEKIVGQYPRGIPSDLQSQRQYTPPLPTTTNSDTKQSYAKILSKPHSSGVGRDPGSEVDPPSSKTQPLYKMNDRVVIFDKNDIALHGTVKWTGRKNRLGGGRVIHVGIEMVYLRVPYHSCLKNQHNYLIPFTKLCKIVHNFGKGRHIYVYVL